MLLSKSHSSLTKSIARLLSVPVVLLGSLSLPTVTQAETLTVRVTGGTIFANGAACQDPPVQIGVPKAHQTTCTFDFPAGTPVSLTTIPATAYNFPANLWWQSDGINGGYGGGITVDGSNCDNGNGALSPCEIVMNGNMGAGASFSLDSAYSIIGMSGIRESGLFMEGGLLRVNENVSITARTCSGEYAYGECLMIFPSNSQVTFSAIANPGYEFSGWSAMWIWDGLQCASAATETCQVNLSGLGQWVSVAVPHFSQVTISCDGSSVATYSNETRQAVLPCVEIPIYIDINGKPTQWIGLYSSVLEIPFGFSDFTVKTLTFSKVVQTSSPSNAKFEPDSGILSIPIIDVPTTVPLLVGSGSIPGPTLRCRATLQQSVLRAEVLMLTDSQCDLL